MTNTVIAPDSGRFFLDRTVKAIAQTYGISPEQARSSYKFAPQTVIIGNPLRPNVSTYNFSPRNNVGVSYPTSVRLDQNDFFAIKSIGLYFGRAAYASNSGQYSNFGNYPKLTYPYQGYFNGVPAAGETEAACLQTVVNGQYVLTVNADQIISQDSCSKLVCSAMRPNDNFSGDPEYAQFNGLTDPASRGLFTIDPNFVLDMNVDNLITVNLADGDTAGIDGSSDSEGAATAYRNFLWVAMEGIVIKNMASGGPSRGGFTC